MTTNLIDPVRVQHTQVATTLANTLLSNRALVAVELELVHTFTTRLTVGVTVVHQAFTTTTADTDTVDNETLLGLVPKTTSLVWASGL